MLDHLPMLGLLSKKLGGMLMMMQARNGGDDAPTKWYEISASVGHLVLAVVVAVAGGAAFVMGYVWDNHKAITLLQERQTYVLKYIAEDAASMIERDRRLSASLTSISHQVEELKIEVVRHMAQAQAISDYQNGNAGIKRRQ